MAKKDELTQDEIEIKTEALNNPFYFAKVILGYSDMIELHREMLDFAVDHFNKKEDLKECLMLLPRKHFKTSVVTIAFSVWLIVNNPNIRILINNKNLENAKSFLSEIKDHFEKNAKFKYFFGNYKGDLWQANKITVSKRTKLTKDPTIALGSPDKEVTSKAVDAIFNDDLVGLEDMASAAERGNVHSFRKALPYIGDKGCLIVDMGTRWHMYDEYADRLVKLPPDCILKKEAIMNGEPILPNKFTLERLAKLREDDPVLYEAQMNNNPIASEIQLFNPDKLNYFDIDSFKIEDAYIIGYVDPALGKKESTGTKKKDPCFLAFPVAGVINDNLYIIDFITNQEKPDFNEKLISQTIVNYKMKEFGMESNVAQELFCGMIEKELKEFNYRIEVKPINSTGNKDRRIEGIHGIVIRNVFFRRDWKKAYKEAFMQIALYPGHKYKDAPDALAGIINLANLGGGPLVKKSFISSSTDFYEEERRGLI